MCKCQRDFQIDQFQFKDLDNIFDFDISSGVLQSRCCDSGECAVGEVMRELCVHRKVASVCVNLKNKTSFGESLLWFYLVINSVSARGDIYSSSEACPYGRMLLFPEWFLFPLYVIFHLAFIVALRPI